VNSDLTTDSDVLGIRVMNSALPFC